MRSMRWSSLWVMALGVLLVVASGGPALAAHRNPGSPGTFQPHDTTSYAVTHGPSALHGLLVWLAGLGAFLVVGGTYRWYQRTHR
ncbi:MAG TPA: hypothetical protein VFL99_02170 [Segeticoccus sp.]|uniref:hypothetical protein n=1 Tax=Segeticoccus sp. TaxID=2706531 RepID=UPI002D807DA9|nr:hypothetical protein [Segeticoccus sp.]HET8599103.1 hypothetical protein [Segeticoccus sp.]